MFSKYAYKSILIILLSGLLCPQLSFSFPRKNIFDTFAEASFYLLFVGVIGHTFAGMCQHAPYLYEQKSSDEELLQSIEARAERFRFILEKPTEDCLLSFRMHLIQHYKKMVSNRSFSSILFERGIPEQPWALFNVEMQQTLNKLGSLQTRVVNGMFTMIDSQAISSDEQATRFLERIKKVRDFLNEAALIVEAYPTFQSECSQERQEKMNTTLIRNVAALSGIYMMHKLARYLDRYDGQ